jgi:thioredoxin reductase (NADPH)
MQYDCVIVGSGIAGMTCAIYLKRANLNVLIIEQDAPGGLLNKIAKIENYPGFKSISGVELSNSIYEQVNNLGIEIRYGKLLSINNHEITTDIETIKAKRIVLAIGRNTKKQNEILNLSYCAVCDGTFYKNKIVALIGNNNQAIEEALYLSSICKKIYLISNTTLTGEEILKDQLKNKNIEIYENCTLEQLEKEDNIVKKIKTNIKEFEVDGIFISMENEPDTDYLKDIDRENKYINVNLKMQTNIDYIYAIGDVIKKDVYQLTTAASDATIAAINIKKSLM